MSKRLRPARIEIDTAAGPIGVELGEAPGGGIDLKIAAGPARFACVLSPVGDAVRGVAAWLDAYAARRGLPEPPAPPAPKKQPARPTRRGTK